MASPWTSLLESLHSALVDELTGRQHEPKPELGMPQRHRELRLPAPGIQGTIICEVSFSLGEAGEARGFACLAADPACQGKLGAAPAALWAACLGRAGKEFGYRGIRPRWGDARELKGAALPAGFPVPTRVIWIPFMLNPGVCYLGVGA